MSLLYRCPSALREGYTSTVNPGNSPLRLLEFGRLLLSPALREYRNETGGNEWAISFLSGKATVEIVGGNFNRVLYENVGGRNDVFSVPPTMIYVPRNSSVVVKAVTERVEAGVFKAPSEKNSAPVLVRGDDVRVETRGSEQWVREVCTSIGTDVNASKLIVGETWNMPGRWSGYPPHKHDEVNPPEGEYEEIYFFSIAPPQGFGIQRIYTSPGHPEPLDEVYVLRNGDAVAIPRGYHPVAAGGGYKLHYLWALSGKERKNTAWSTDPDHAWLLDIR